ncbi:MAG TPA: hypothetical protein VFB82_01355 [Blastocatellia bacterium]|nr:hypothetical protein [Blastocatellia bacterium]
MPGKTLSRLLLVGLLCSPAIGQEAQLQDGSDGEPVDSLLDQAPAPPIPLRVGFVYDTPAATSFGLDHAGMRVLARQDLAQIRPAFAAAGTSLVFAGFQRVPGLEEIDPSHPQQLEVIRRRMNADRLVAYVTTGVGPNNCGQALSYGRQYRS